MKKLQLQPVFKNHDKPLERDLGHGRPEQGRSCHSSGTSGEEMEDQISDTRMLKIRCRSISTVEGSGATCTRNCFELFFQNR